MTPSALWIRDKYNVGSMYAIAVRKSLSQIFDNRWLWQRHFKKYTYIL